MDPTGQRRGVQVLRLVGEEVRGAALVEPSDDQIDPGAQTGQRPLRTVLADHPHDRGHTHSVGVDRQAGLARPFLERGVTAHRGGVQRPGVQHHPTHPVSLQQVVEPSVGGSAGEERVVTQLDHPRAFAGEGGDEAGEHSERLRPEGGRKLDLEGAHPLAERLEALEERRHDGPGVDEATLVGDRPRQLEREAEVGGRLVGPAVDGPGRRFGVERGVALHGVAPACVLGEFATPVPG